VANRLSLRATLGGVRLSAKSIVVSGLTLAALVAALWSGGAAEAKTRSCGTVAAPGYHAFNTKARGLKCTTARRIVKNWLDADAKPSTGPRGWHCRRSVVEPWSCKRDRQRIGFIFHSY
jgi:hypothetical protein